MQKPNVDFLKIQISKALSDEKEIYSSFKIDFDPMEKEDPKTNFDVMMVHWVLPKIINKKLDLDEICNSLVTAHNEIPLWIRLEKNVSQKYYQLYISKRFRKLKAIKEWHKNNEIQPILKH